ncbi:histone-lysine N-methyltransferase SETDB2 isoform X2 [Perognathus longimembris pacificus]|uniref:histone-lysine N-methyltransferase SETDB2 isoform X2 n=1 Tax=Perognathus longimembris pacificus TaxID=214514 RepID=UPI002019A8AC|nr:histone-lysine N-methyltransferase SETDB2 isoform X2 [Perognathus longimembris pacificus]
MGEKNGDAKAFWMELEDDGKVDFIFEKVQNVLHSLKQKIKDRSATNKEYIQAMILVNEATISNNSTLVKDKHMIQNEKEKKSNVFPSITYENSFTKDRILQSIEKQEVFLVEHTVVNHGEKEKESSLKLPYKSHNCSSACLIKMPATFKGENPLQLPIKCHFQRQHAKTNSHSSALHVSYKTPCGKSLRNMEDVFHYLLETECNFLFTDNFSFNTYVQLTRNHPREEVVISDADISNGVESVPISFCNEIDSRKLPLFKYRKTVWPRACYVNNFSNMFTDSCDCSEGCIDITKCACLQLTSRNAKTCLISNDRISTGYKYKRLQRQIPTGIYECNLLCKCNRQICQNRVVQHGPQVRLQVFKTAKKGWGVRCLDDLDRGTFICIYSGRLLSRDNPGKPKATDESGNEEDIIKNTCSKKRKIEASSSDCEVELIPVGLEKAAINAKTEEHLPQFSDNPKEPEPITKMNFNNISRTHSVIRSPKSKTALFQRNGKKMGFVSLESLIPEDNHGFKVAQENLILKARRPQEDSNSNQFEDSEDKQLIESDVIDITKCKQEIPPGGRCNQAAISYIENIRKKFLIQIQMSREENSSACQNQQAFCEEFSSEVNTSSDSLMKFNEGSVFLLDASKEGNVGRFLNHSCCPNLFVQNVFVETHDRNFPLVAFFTNRYVKARTELTWDYGYEAGTMPDKEILCQCGVNNCRKKIL